MSLRFEFTFSVTGLLGDPSPMHIWTGQGELTIGGQTYTPTNIVAGVTTNGGNFVGAETRLTLELFATTDALRSEFLQDPGPGRVVVRQVVSSDDGANWSQIPRAFAGRLTTPRLVGDRYQVDLVDRYGDPLRPAPRYWSHEDQITRFAGDMGLSHMRAIETGVNVRWP